MIYFIQDGSNFSIKIGYAKTDAEARMATLQTGNSAELVLLATMDGDRSQEAGLHRLFAEYRVAGEWFRPCPDLLRLIGRAMPSSPPAPADVRKAFARLLVADCKDEILDMVREVIVKELPEAVAVCLEGMPAQVGRAQWWPARWPRLFDMLGPIFGNRLEKAGPPDIDDDTLALLFTFPPECAQEWEFCSQPERVARIQDAMREIDGAPWSVEMRCLEGKSS